MNAHAIIHTVVELPPSEVKRITVDQVESLYGVLLNKDVRPDSLYVDDNGNLIKCEDLRGGIERTIIRKATELDFAISKVLEELKMRN